MRLTEQFKDKHRVIYNIIEWACTVPDSQWALVTSEGARLAGPGVDATVVVTCKSEADQFLQAKKQHVTTKPEFIKFVQEVDKALSGKAPAVAAV